MSKQVKSKIRVHFYVLLSLRPAIRRAGKIQAQFFHSLNDWLKCVVHVQSQIFILALLRRSV